MPFIGNPRALSYGEKSGCSFPMAENRPPHSNIKIIVSRRKIAVSKFHWDQSEWNREITRIYPWETNITWRISALSLSFSVCLYLDFTQYKRFVPLSQLNPAFYVTYDRFLINTWRTSETVRDKVRSAANALRVSEKFRKFQSTRKLEEKIAWHRNTSFKERAYIPLCGSSLKTLKKLIKNLRSGVIAKIPETRRSLRS